MDLFGVFHNVMFGRPCILQKKILFARGLNWDQSCLWKTPPSHFLLFSPLLVHIFKKISSPDFWGVKEAPCKNLYVFGENSQRNQFPKLTTFLLHFSLMSPLCHSALAKDSHEFCRLACYGLWERCAKLSRPHSTGIVDEARPCPLLRSSQVDVGKYKHVPMCGPPMIWQLC